MVDSLLLLTHIELGLLPKAAFVALIVGPGVELSIVTSAYSYLFIVEDSKRLVVSTRSVW